MDAKSLQKASYLINTVIVIIVLGLWGFFYLLKAKILVIFSIPTLMIYLIGYVLIRTHKLNIYVRMVYFWLTLYMFLTTICLGYNYGFHLYSLSMIPILYYTNYMAYKLNQPYMKTGLGSAIILIAYLGCTVYVAAKGPIYEGSETSSAFFWICNSVIVFSFLIYYTRMLINNIISSEETLKEMSYVDRLTGLYNRHYMMDQLERSIDATQTDTVAIIDIDDFKKINDVYGHNAGDYVLRKLSDMMKQICPKAVVSRWGGEEFLILVTAPDSAKDLMETLRRKVEEEHFEFEGRTIKVTVTIGLAKKEDSKGIDKWIQEADDKLYIGKKNGKNAVIL